MSEAAEQIATQYANAAKNKRDWGSILVNVKVNGAMGNGSSDDTAVIQSSIDAVSAAGGGRVYFPRGTYRTTGAIFMKPHVLLEGDIPGNVYYNSSTVAGPTIKYEGTDWAVKFPESPNASQSGIKNLNITGNASAKGGIKINEAVLGPDPSLDLYFEAVCVSQFPNGYGLWTINTWRNAFYTMVIRQCGCGISMLDVSNDISFVDPTIEWCALGINMQQALGIYFFGINIEGVGVRPDVSLPSDLYVWTAKGRVLSDYYGGMRNLGSNASVYGGYMEYIDTGKFFMMELDALQTITGVDIQCTAPAGHVEKVIVEKANGALALVFTGNRIFNSPSGGGVIDLDGSSFNCMIHGNTWIGTVTGSFFVNIGTHIDGGLIQAPDKPSEVMLSYEQRVYARDANNTSGVKLFGPYSRSALDNYWEWYRQNGDGPGKFAGIRRINNDEAESYMIFDDKGVHPVKPLVFDTQITEASAPLSGLFVDSADGKLKFKNANGTVILLY